MGLLGSPDGSIRNPETKNPYRRGRSSSYRIYGRVLIRGPVPPQPPLTMSTRVRWARRQVLCWLPIVLPALVTGCDPAGPSPIQAAGPGEPLPGLPAEALEHFHAGYEVFLRQFTSATGLGPLFNDDSCFSCHDTPTSGGGGADPVTLASRWDPDTETCHLPNLTGAVVQQRVTPEYRQLLDSLGLRYEAIQEGVTSVVEMLPPPLYGFGLVEAIPDSAILANQNRQAEEGWLPRPGRALITADGRLGRFGKKASHPDLLDFNAGALLGEMGITTSLHPDPILPAFQTHWTPPPAPSPPLPDEELELLTAYLRYLAPPARRIPSDRFDRSMVQRGEVVFSQIGCAGCHVPEMVTGPSENPALDRVPVALYSDLLLHDLGPAMASICSPGATPSEWRTAILMGLRYRSELLHDGRAGRLEQAIDYHGGSAQPSRDAFRELDRADREALLAFLRTL